MRVQLTVGLLLITACASSGSSDGDAPPAFQGSPAVPSGPAPTDPTPTAPADVPDEASAAPGTNEDPNANVGGIDMAAVDPGSAVSPGAAGAAAGGAGGSASQPAEVPGEPTEIPLGPAPSAGCSNATSPVGDLTINVGGANAPYLVTLPAGYDGTTPVPLIFGFHGRGRTHTQFATVDAAQIQTELGSRAVMVYLKSQAGDGWNFAAEVEPNVAFFEALYPVVLANYCVDTSRIFAVGHSSGGYFSNILACRFGDRFRGIGVVAGQSQETNCVGRVAAMVIHGVRDSVVSFAGGQASRDTYAATNGCSSTTTPNAVSPCIDYQGCAEGLPVSWCEHDEPTYENTNHGWPSFASRAIGQFLFALP